MQIVLLFVLIGFNGWLASAEMALMTVKKNRLKAMQRRGKKTAGLALELAGNPTRLLSTIQIGITAIGLLNGIVGEAAFSGLLSAYLQQAGMEHAAAHTISTILVVLSITYFSIVIGELIPKRIAQNNAETIACLSAPALRLLSIIAKPFVWLLSRSTEAALAWQSTPTGSSELTHEDLQALLQQGGQDGVLGKQQQLWMDNVLHFDQRRASECMTLLNKLEYIDLEQDRAQQLATVLKTRHAYLPLCQGAAGEIKGVVAAKDYLAYLLQNKTQFAPELILAPIFVPATLHGLKLLEMLQNKQAHMLFVVDEYGQLSGIITWQNVVNALGGMHGASGMMVRKLADGSYLLAGNLGLRELQKLLGIEELPASGDYQTLAGLLQCLLRSSGSSGAQCSYAGWNFRILSMHKNRIKHVRAKPQNRSNT